MQQPKKRERVIIQAEDRFAPIMAIADPDMEQALVCCVFHNKDLYPALAEIVQSTDFTTLSLGLFWFAFDKLAPHIDNVSVTAYLLDNGHRQDRERVAREIDDLILLVDRIDLNNAEHYAHIVRERAVRVRMFNALDEMRSAVLQDGLSLEERIDQCNALLFEATEQRAGLKATSASHFLEQVTDDLENGADHIYVPTGYPYLDDKLGGGAATKEVSVLVGKDGMGKTTFLLNMVYNRLMDGKPRGALAMFCLEQTGKQIMQSLSAIHTGIARKAFKRNDLTAAQWQTYVEGLAVMDQWPLHLIDKTEYPSLSPVQLRRRLRRMQMESALDMVVIDGLWLMEPHNPPRGSQRFEHVRTIMRDLTDIAEEFDVPIWLAHQYSLDGINRQRQLKRPSTEDIAESSNVRYTAQLILGLFRPKVYALSDDDTTQAYILKDRSGGESGFIEFDFMSGKYQERRP